MSYRVAAFTAGGLVALGAIGAVGGPGWHPEAFSAELDVTTSDTRIVSSAEAGDMGLGQVGDYEVRTTTTTVTVDGQDLNAVVYQPVDAPDAAPGVVFIHGAGTGEAGTAFVANARALASAGVVAMVPDKRMDTYSTRHRDYQAMAEDYLASVRVLRSWPGVDASKVGVYGESEGGWIAPIAAATDHELAFVVLVSAPVVTPRQQAAFAVDNYLRNTQVPMGVFRAIPRALGMEEFPGGGFEYVDFDVSPYQQQVTVPVLVVYGTADASVPMVQGAQAVIADLTEASNDDWTVRYYADADHGIRHDGELAADFAADLALWVQLAADGDISTVTRVAGAQPEQSFVAEAVASPRWYAQGDMAVLGAVVCLVLIGAGPLLSGLAGLAGRRVARIPAELRGPMSAMRISVLTTLIGLIGYLWMVSELAVTYRSNVLLVKGGWLAVRAVGVVAATAASTVVSRLVDIRRLGNAPAVRTGLGALTLGGGTVGSVGLLVLLAYWGVFPIGIA